MEKPSQQPAHPRRAGAPGAGVDDVKKGGEGCGGFARQLREGGMGKLMPSNV